MGPHERYLEKHSEFYHAYGLAMANWSELERTFANLFVAMTRMQADTGLAIFYSARSFLGRADMFMAAAATAPTLPKGREFLVQAMKRAQAWTATRNALAHDEHGLMPDQEEPGLAIRPRVGAPIGAPDLIAATFNFRRLADLILMSRADSRLLREPELSLAALDLLPVDARMGSIDQTRVDQLLGELAHTSG
jgi:hypothetical protein